MSRFLPDWQPPAADNGTALALAALVLTLGGTAHEADLVQAELHSEALPLAPSLAVEQVTSALERVRRGEGDA